MSIKLHCNDCSNDYDTILDIEDLDSAVCPRCGSFGSSVQVTETLEEPLTPPPPAAPVANPREVEIRPEASSKQREGQYRTPLSENAVRGNTEGRFSRVSSKKGLFLAIAGILVLLLAAGITWTVTKGPGASSGGVDVVIERESQNPQAPEKKTEEAGEQTEQQASQTPEKPAPAHQERKTVKKAPAKTPTPKASTAPNTPWRYRVESPAPKPAQPRAQAKETGNPLGKLFKVFDGPAPDVTPPPSVNDPRGSGM